MMTRPLGNTGFDVTEIGFGAWGIGSRHYGPVAESDAREALETYVGAGGNFIDTARGYAESERIIGQFLKSEDLRDKIVLCSKSGPHDPDIVREELETSLRLLQTDHLDVYYIHQPPDDAETMNRLLDLYTGFREEGKIRAVAASIKGGNVTPATQELCRTYIDTGRVHVLQIIFSIFRQSNGEVFDHAARAGVGLVGRTVLENGFLTGKYAPGHRFEGNWPDGDHRSRWNGPKLDAILDEVQKIQARAVQPPYETLPQVALRFALDEPGLSTIIPGAKNARQARANTAVADLPPLPPEIRNWLVETYAGCEDLVNL
jgi:aryl-alcohol dehydrogenase-like predicted oxidoreductase